MLKGIVKILFATIAALLMPALVAAQAPQTITAKADSTTLVMGDRVTINLEVLKNSHAGVLLGFPMEPNTDYYGLEYLDQAADSTDLGNGRVQLKYHLYFQAFDPSELLTLPPFFYAIDGDTIVTDIVTLKVLPVDLSPELGDPNDIESLTIHPDEQPITLPSRWYDVVPDWWIWVVFGLIVVALGIIIWMLYKKNGPAIFVPRKQPTPYDIAVRRLEELKRRRLIEKGQTKTYYTQLIDILRIYLDGRFGINAMEMTSKQILQKLRENQETHLSSSQIEEVLRLADFVKFAAANPDPQEGLRTFNTISSFVEATKPLPEPEDEKGKKKK